MKKQIRKFKTGGTRDVDIDKLDYEGFLSPLVLQKFAEYMHGNRKQKDGSVRDSDNWQNLFGEEHYDVCMKSLSRHYMDMWCNHRGVPAREGMHEAMMGVLFNTMAYAFKYYQGNTTEPTSKSKSKRLQR